VESALGRSRRFTFTLPLAPTEPIAGETETGAGLGAREAAAEAVG
jgi:hypothetical protein